MCAKGDDDQKAVCKEIRHNSTGCLKMKDRCDKCQEILSVGELWVRVQAFPVLGYVLGSLVPRGVAFFQIPALCLRAVTPG